MSVYSVLGSKKPKGRLKTLAKTYNFGDARYIEERAKVGGWKRTKINQISSL